MVDKKEDPASSSRGLRRRFSGEHKRERECDDAIDFAPVHGKRSSNQNDRQVSGSPKFGRFRIPAILVTLLALAEISRQSTKYFVAKISRLGDSTVYINYYDDNNNNKKDDDDDDHSYYGGFQDNFRTNGRNDHYDGDDNYYFPERIYYDNTEDYEHDWEVFKTFASNYGSGNELSVLLNCPDVHSADRYANVVIPDEESFKLMNKVYHSTMAKYRTNESKYDTFPTEYRSQMTLSTEVRIAPVVGRGIFATEDIPEGSVVWKSTNTAEFRSGNAYRKFIIGLSMYDKDLACDAILWSYIVKASPTEFAACIDMDAGGMFNDAMGVTRDTDVGGIDRDTKYGCTGRSLYATRNIQANTELHVDYGTFVQGDWNRLGLCAWGESPPSVGCEAAAKATYLKDKEIKKRIAPFPIDAS